MSNAMNRKERRAAGIKSESEKTKQVIQYVESYNGPIPSAGQLEKYEMVLPGSADRILKMAEKQQDHRMSLETKVIGSEVSGIFRGQWMAFAVMLIVLGVASFFQWYGYTTFAITLGGLDLITLCTIFIYGKKADSKNTSDSNVIEGN